MKIIENGIEKIKEELYDTVIQAIGRDTTFEDMNLEKIGIQLDKNKKIPIDK